MIGHVPLYHTKNSTTNLLPTGNLLYRYDASLDALNTTYANNALLPNHAGVTGYDFKSYIFGVLDSIVITASHNNKQSLKIFGGTFGNNGGVISVSEISPESNPITLISIVSVPTGVDNGGYSSCIRAIDRGGINRYPQTSRVSLRSYTATQWDYTPLAATNSPELFISELPANTETEPKTFRLYQNSNLLIEQTNSTDLGVGIAFPFICPLNGKPIYVHEYMVYNRRLTVQEKTNVAANLMTKWGIV